MSETAESAPTPAPQAKPSLGRGLLNALWPFLPLALVFAIFCVADRQMNPEPSFYRERNVRIIAKQAAVVGVAALGMTLVIISGGIDLSAGTAIALCSMVMAAGLLNNLNPALVVIMTILTGCLCGLLNGLLISILGVVPFIVTLGTMQLFLGLAKLVANQVAASGTIHLAPRQIPQWVVYFNDTRSDALIAGFPLGFWVLLLLGVLTWILLRYTVFGRYVFALGSNESTARLCGINVWANKILVYTLSGFFVGVAGMYLFAQTTVGTSDAGLGKELYVIAAVVIGGGSLSGGRGSVVGTLTGAALIFVIHSGGTLLGIDNEYQNMMLGLIIISAVTVDQYRQRRLSAA